jgi:hypothetical protein
MVLSPLVPGIDAFAKPVKVLLVRHNVPSFHREWDLYEQWMFQNIHANGWGLLKYSPLVPQVTGQQCLHHWRVNLLSRRLGLDACATEREQKHRTGAAGPHDQRHSRGCALIFDHFRPQSFSPITTMTAFPAQAKWAQNRAFLLIENHVLHSASFEEGSGDLRFVQQGASQISTIEYGVSQAGARQISVCQFRAA